MNASMIGRPYHFRILRDKSEVILVLARKKARNTKDFHPQTDFHSQTGDGIFIITKLLWFLMIWNICPACTAPGTAFVADVRDRAIFRCDACGHKFVREPISQSALVDRYQGMSYFHENCGHQGIDVIEDDGQWEGFENERFRKLTSLGVIPQPVPPGFRVLEIGCLEGRVLRKLAEQGCRVTGLEVNATVAERGRKAFGIDIVTVTAEDWDYPADTFDAVVSFHTFEHLIDPAFAADRSFHALKPGGRILIEVPADDDELDNMDHFHFFTDGSGRRFMDRWFIDVDVVPNAYMRGGLRRVGSIYLIGRKPGA